MAGLDLDLSRAWLVDPAGRREGPGEIVVRGGVIRSVRWLRGDEARGVDDRGVVVAPAFVDLHAHLREPGNASAETVASGLAAAAHGGFGTVCVMPNTSPPTDGRGAVERLSMAGVQVLDDLPDGFWPPSVLPYGAVSAARAGEQLSAMGELADAGVVGFSDDGSPVHSATLFRSALAYAGMLGLPIVDHAEDPRLTEGAEASAGLIATVLGLRGWPVAAEASVVARDIAILEELVGEVPGARLHVTHVSTAAALELVRAAKARGLPVTCDVTPHHLALTDEWLAGARRWAWEALDERGRRRDPWADGVLLADPYDTAAKVNPPLRSPEDAAACRAALRDGTADAIATDHAPHSDVDKAVEFGLAPNGISGIETALGVLLAAVDAGEVPLIRALEALTAGPWGVLAGGGGSRQGGEADAGRPATDQGGLVEGAPAELVVFDRSTEWEVTRETLRSRGKNSPLLGMRLAGRVLLTVHDGLLAYRDEELAPA